MTLPVPDSPAPETAVPNAPDTPPAWEWTEQLAGPVSTPPKHVLLSLASSGLFQLALVTGLAFVHGSFQGWLMRIPPPPGAQSWNSYPSFQAIDVTASSPDDDRAAPTIFEGPEAKRSDAELSPPSAQARLVSPRGEQQPVPHTDFQSMGEADLVVTRHTDSPLARQAIADATPVRPREPLQAREIPKAAPQQPAKLEKSPPIASVSSPASAPSQAADGAKNDLPPRAIFNPSPEYPPDALAARITGRVVLRVRVAADGTVEAASVQTSSGVPSLDQSALVAVRRWRFEPTKRKDVLPRAQDIAVPIRFVLEP